MSSPQLYLSRARLRTASGEALAALAPVLLAGSKGDTVGHAHRILWMLFAGGGEGQTRDFLWREERPGHYVVLSRRQPQNTNGLFELETKEFAPALGKGDLLRFALRANPVVTRKTAWEAGKEKRDRKGRIRGMRCDIVMDALSSIRPAERGQKRDEVLKSAGLAWFTRQGETHGFRVWNNPETERPCFSAENYETIEIPRMKEANVLSRKQFARFGVLDFSGVVEVTDPEKFLEALPHGLGKAKAFGCGLMLVRRA